MPQLPAPDIVAPHATVPDPADQLMIAQVILDDPLSARADDPLLSNLRDTVEAVLTQQLPRRTELLVVIHAAPGNNEALAFQPGRLSSVPRRSDRRVHLVEDASDTERGSLAAALPDLDPLPFRRVLRVTLDLGSVLPAGALHSIATLAWEARHANSPVQGAMAISQESMPAWVLAVDAPESLTLLDAFASPVEPTPDDLGLLAALGGGTAVRVEQDEASGAKVFVPAHLAVALQVTRRGTDLTVDCDLGPLASAKPTVCYYVLQNGRRVARRWYASSTAATFEDVAAKVVVRAFVRVGGQDVARAESEVV
ncbi:hypothetical protein [Brachybacterium tyrofermentans]|uniref:hypothetical protein n=1 Tax=Brachybacterium tyrofermentans TaxID=47848 RepID=UPI003FD585F1